MRHVGRDEDLVGGGGGTGNIRDNILNTEDTKSVESVDRTAKRDSAFDAVT
jgi:hypothetical protein